MVVKSVLYFLSSKLMFNSKIKLIMDCNTYKIMLKNKTIEQFIKNEKKPYGTYLENVVYKTSKLRALKKFNMLGINGKPYIWHNQVNDKYYLNFMNPQAPSMVELNKDMTIEELTKKIEEEIKKYQIKEIDDIFLYIKFVQNTEKMIGKPIEKFAYKKYDNTNGLLCEVINKYNKGELPEELEEHIDKWMNKLNVIELFTMVDKFGDNLILFNFNLN